MMNFISLYFWRQSPSVCVCVFVRARMCERENEKGSKNCNLTQFFSAKAFGL